MIIETGEGLPNADSYASQEDTAIYHSDRGNTQWVMTTDAGQISALIRATDYLDGHYRAHGFPLNPAQGLQWPRAGDGAVPRAVRHATMMLALEALSGPLTGRAERGVKSITESAEGVGSTSTTYDDTLPTDLYPHVTAILSDVATLRSAGRGVWVGRVIK